MGGLKSWGINECRSSLWRAGWGRQENVGVASL